MGWGLILELLKIRRKTDAASASVPAALGYPFPMLAPQRALVARLHSKRRNSVFVELARQQRIR